MSVVTKSHLKAFGDSLRAALFSDLRAMLDWTLAEKVRLDRGVVAIESTHGVILASASHVVLAMEPGTALYWAAVRSGKHRP